MQNCALFVFCKYVVALILGIKIVIAQCNTWLMGEIEN